MGFLRGIFPHEYMPIITGFMNMAVAINAEYRAKEINPDFNRMN